MTKEQERLLKLTPTGKRHLSLRTERRGSLEIAFLTEHNLNTNQREVTRWERSVYDFSKYAFYWAGYVKEAASGTDQFRLTEHKGL